MSDSTEKYQPATIGDALRDAFEEAEKPAETPEEPVEAEAATEEPGEPADEPAEGSEPEVKTEAIEPPEHWPEADKEVFRSQSADVQGWMIERDKERDRLITEKTTEIAESRKRFEGLEKVLEPYRPYLQGNEAQVIGNSLQMQAYLASPQVSAKDKYRALQSIAQTFGLDVDNLSQEDAGYDEPEPWRGEIDQLKQQQSQETAMREAQNRIEAFKNAKDGEGNPLHPHFDALEADMANLVAGGMTDLETAYEKAYERSPARMEERERAAAEKALADFKASQEKARKEKAKAAKKASSKVVEGKPSAKEVEDVPETIRDALAREWERQAS